METNIDEIKTAIDAGLKGKASAESVVELNTKNDELELKLKELTEANTEMKNLIADLKAKNEAPVVSNEPLRFNMGKLSAEVKEQLRTSMKTKMPLNITNIDTKELTIGAGEGEALAIDQELGRSIIERARENVTILNLIGSKNIGSVDYREMVLTGYPLTGSQSEQSGGAGGNTAPGDIWALTATATYEGVALKVGKQYAKPIISNEAINDPHIDIYAHLQTLLAEELSRYWALQVIYGNGAADNIRGILSASRISAAQSILPTFPTTASPTARNVEFYPVQLSAVEDSIGASDPTAANSAIDNAIDLTVFLPSRHLAGARFTMNRRTLGAYRKLKDLDGRPMVQFEDGGFNLVGYGINIEDYLPDADGTNPANYALADMRYPVIFGRLDKAYALCHISDNFLFDPYSADGGVMLKFESRKGDIIQSNDAIVVLRTDGDFV